MALVGSQVNETVMAYRVPLASFSTKWTFSDPDVKNDSRPCLGSTVLLVSLSMKIKRPPVKSVP